MATISKDIEEFIKYFCEQIGELVTHDFICKQYVFMNHMKKNLKRDFISIMDFEMQLCICGSRCDASVPFEQ